MESTCNDIDLYSVSEAGKKGDTESARTRPTRLILLSLCFSSRVTAQLHLENQQWYERGRWRRTRQEGERAAGKMVMEETRASVRLHLVGGYPNWVLGIPVDSVT